MAATVVSGLTNITVANDTTGFDTWKRDGTGGTPSAVSSTDVFIHDTGSCSVRVSDQGVVLAYGTGGLDLSASNTHVYIWANQLAGGLLQVRDTTTDPGIGIFLGYDTNVDDGTNYNIWAVDGSDTYPGGWVRYVIDVSKTATISVGTQALASTTWVGIYCRTTATARFDNLYVDRIDYTAGPGLVAYGTSTTDDLFQDLLDADEGTVTNRYGILTSKGGIIYSRGRIVLGDSAGTNAASLTDVDKVVVFEDPRYYDGTADASCVSDTLYRFDVVGNGTGSTSVTLGKKVGTGDDASGRNGLLVSSAGPTVSMDFDDGNVNAALVYGTEFRDITGTLSWGTNTAHELIGCTFNGCNQFDPVGGIVIRDCTFVNLWDDGTADASNNAALLWNSSIDIKKCNFIANSHTSSDVAHGIEHDTIISVATGTVTTADATGTTLTDSAASFTTSTAVGEYIYNETDGSYGKITSVDSATQVTCETLQGGTDNDFDLTDAYSISAAISYSDLTFSSNEVDVLNSAANSDGLFISKSGTSNPSTATGNVVFIGSVPITITVVDGTNTVIQNAQTTVRLSSDNSEIINADTNASGQVSGSFTGTTPATALVKVRKSSPGDTRYQNFSTTGTISTSGLSVTVVLTEDGAL